MLQNALFAKTKKNHKGQKYILICKLINQTCDPLMSK